MHSGLIKGLPSHSRWLVNIYLTIVLLMIAESALHTGFSDFCKPMKKLIDTTVIS